MELELEVSESEDYSEFPACESVEVKLCQRCKRKSNSNFCLYQCEERG